MSNIQGNCHSTTNGRTNAVYQSNVWSHNSQVNHYCSKCKNGAKNSGPCDKCHGEWSSGYSNSEFRVLENPVFANPFSPYETDSFKASYEGHQNRELGKSSYNNTGILMLNCHKNKDSFKSYEYERQPNREHGQPSFNSKTPPFRDGLHEIKENFKSSYKYEGYDNRELGQLSFNSISPQFRNGHHEIKDNSKPFYKGQHNRELVQQPSFNGISPQFRNGFHENIDGFKSSYEEQHNRELVQPQYNSISVQYNNEFYENKESQQLIVPSLPSSNSSIMSGIGNQSLEHKSPSSSNNDFYEELNKTPISSSSKAFLPKTDHQGSESLLNSSQYQGLIGFDNLHSPQLCDQYSRNASYLSNLPTYPPARNPKHRQNNDTHTQDSRNTSYYELEKLLGNLTISHCNHWDTKELFCNNCREFFCIRCKSKHEFHSLTTTKAIGELTDTSMQAFFVEKENEVRKALQKIDAVKIELNKNHSSVHNAIQSEFRSLENLLTNQKEMSDNNIDSITKSKISNLESQLEKMIGRDNDNVIPSETSNIYLNDITCDKLFDNCGLVYSSANSISESGIALSTIVIDNPCGFIIQCYDHLGKKCFTGGDDVTATLTYPDKVECHVNITDLKNGLYQGFVETSIEGDHSLIINLRKRPISRKYILKSKYYISLDTIIRNPWTYDIVKKTNNNWVDIHCDKNGRLFITDTTAHCFHIYDHKHKKIKTVGGQGKSDGEFQSPHGITVDNSKRIIVADTDNHRVQVFSYDGDFLLQFGSLGSEKSQFQNPKGVATDSEGNIAVSDSGNNRVQLFDRLGNFLAVSKNNSSPRLLSNNSSPRLSSPYGIYFESDNTLLVSSSSENPVIKFILTRNPYSLSFAVEETSFHYFKNYGMNTGLIKSNNYYIFTANENKVGLVFFYNSMRGIPLYFNGITYAATVSPEGYLYIIVKNNLDQSTELYIYPNNYNMNRECC